MKSPIVIVAPHSVNTMANPFSPMGIGQRVAIAGVATYIGTLCWVIDLASIRNGKRTNKRYEVRLLDDRQTTLASFRTMAEAHRYAEAVDSGYVGYGLLAGTVDSDGAAYIARSLAPAVYAVCITAYAGQWERVHTGREGTEWVLVDGLAIYQPTY